MNATPPDNKQEPSEDGCESVQDYLDLLLSRATEDPAAQIDDVTPSSALAASQKQRAIPSTAQPQRSYRQDKSREEPLRESQLSSQHSAEIKETATKPFAEPRSSLSIKAPLAEVKLQSENEPAAKKVQQSPESVSTVAVPQQPEKRTQALVNEPPITGVAAVAADSGAEAAKDRVEVTPWLANGRPSWAQERFECLLFTVGGLTLAVPLAELGSIYPLSGEITPLFGQIDWFLGLLTVKDINIRVVNTPQVVMPERYHEAMKERYQNVISINGVDWGLAVDHVSSAISLNPEDVRWRGKRSKRPWLAGTVVEHMCALLDLSQLAQMFVEQES